MFGGAADKALRSADVAIAADPTLARAHGTRALAFGRRTECVCAQCARFFERGVCD